MNNPAPQNSFNPSIVLSCKVSSLEEARVYCRQLARSHYENFLVGSIFVPKLLRQHFYNIYAYCRLSDDLGDECTDPAIALESLDQWEFLLKECYRGRPQHPVFMALQETITQFEIPLDPFADLLKAFRLDQTKKRYATYDELLQYCHFSANPVGRLVLYLGEYRDEERQSLSDCTCTGLQLANHWQDVDRDFRRLGRIYIPEEDLKQFAYSEHDIRNQTCDMRFQSLMKKEVERARIFFQKGMKLSSMVNSRLAREVALFNLTGLEVLRRIESVEYDIFRRRPTLSKGTVMRLLIRTLWKPGKNSSLR
jgi:squalene synthase HpnC